MEVGLSLGLEIQKGTLYLSLIDCGCVVKEISITLDGGESWLYQGYANLPCSHLCVRVCAPFCTPSVAALSNEERKY